MNNIYVETIPKRCDSCVGYGGASGRCKLLHKPAFVTPPKDCPLKLITDRLAEERKKVVQEIKDKISDGLYQNSYGETFIDGDIYEILDRIERGK